VNAHSVRDQLLKVLVLALLCYLRQDLFAFVLLRKELVHFIFSKGHISDHLGSPGRLLPRVDEHDDLVLVGSLSTLFVADFVHQDLSL